MTVNLSICLFVNFALSHSSTSPAYRDMLSQFILKKKKKMVHFVVMRVNSGNFHYFYFSGMANYQDKILVVQQPVSLFYSDNSYN